MPKANLIPPNSRPGVLYRRAPSRPGTSVTRLFLRGPHRSSLRKWTLDHTWQGLNDRLRALVRFPGGQPLSSYCCHSGQPDRQIRQSRWRCRLRRAQEDQGTRAASHGRHLGLGDRGGWDCRHHPGAARSTRPSESRVVPLIWLRVMWVDGDYSGPAFAAWACGLRPKLKVDMVKRCEDVNGFKVLHRRWVVERTFGWLMRHRRLVRDYEYCGSSAESWAYIAMIRPQLNRLA